MNAPSTLQYIDIAGQRDQGKRDGVCGVEGRAICVSSEAATGCLVVRMAFAPTKCGRRTTRRWRSALLGGYRKALGASSAACA